jgi:hypothetical protein
VFGSSTATSVNGVGTTGTPAVEIKLDTAGDNGGMPRYWRALVHQSGSNPPNSDFLAPCSEITTVRIVQQ